MEYPTTPEFVRVQTIGANEIRVIDDFFSTPKVLQSMVPPCIYFECHVTIDPVMEADGLAAVDAIGATHKFKRAKLLMVKGNEQVLSDKDTFLTAHAKPDGYESLVLRMNDVCRHLQNSGFNVRRAKIEAVMLDSRYANQPYQLRD